MLSELGRIVRRATVATIVTILLLVGFPGTIPIASADTWTQTTDSDFASGTLENLEIIGTGEGASLQLEAKGTWGVWRKLGLSSRVGHDMVYDAANNKVVLFGGLDEVRSDETWICDVNTGVWTLNSPSVKPSARTDHAMAYDSVQGKVVLFGGSDGARNGETWTYDLVSDTWTEMNPEVSPSARYDHDMVYDSANGRIVLFGGWDGSRSDETWTYDLASNTWTQMDPDSSPPARDRHAMAYCPDGENGEVVLFGGHDQESRLDDTWIYDIAIDNWTEINPDDKPGARDDHAMACGITDGGADIVLFGGQADDEKLDDTWLYNLDSGVWTEIDIDTKPAARSGHAIILDSANDKVIAFGDLSDTWAYDITTSTWEEIDMNAKPSARSNHAMTYVLGSGKIVLFGGYDRTGRLDDTWVYDVSTGVWQLMSLDAKPSPRDRHAMVYDSDNNVVILFGGFVQDDMYSNDTWVYDVASNEWELKSPTVKPSARGDHAMVYDPSSSRAILFGGWDGSYDDETWVYDLDSNTWEQLEPIEKPSARGSHTMVYDSLNSRVVMFGGWDGSYDDETWAYDLSSDMWKQMNPPTKPSARLGHAMSYDASNGRVVLFGGHDGSYDGETWVYDLTLDAWTEMIPDVAPPATSGHAVSFDPSDKSIVLFGGLTGDDTYNDDTWKYDLKNYYDAGIYTSRTFVANASNWHTISWAADVDNAEDLQCQVAVNNDGVNWDYVGPDGTALTYYDDATGGALYPEHNGRFLRYRAYLSSSGGNTPRLHEVHIGYVEIGQPEVEVVSPNGEELFIGGDSYSIRWKASGAFGPAPISLYYSADSGMSWIGIETGLANTGQYTWVVPEEEMPEVLVKVVATDLSGNNTSNISDDSFTIGLSSEFIYLHEGWNFVSTPARLATGSNRIEDVFGDVDREGNPIYLFDDGSWIEMQDIDIVRPLDAIWIFNAGDSTTVDLDFDPNPLQSPPTKALEFGWNAVGLSSKAPINTNSALSSVESKWTFLVGYDAEAGLYEAVIVNNDETGSSHDEDNVMKPATGYWLYVTEDGELAGITEGASVVEQVAGEAREPAQVPRDISSRVPLVPEAYSGELIINSKPAPVGTEIVATINGVQKSEPFLTTEPGKYGGVSRHLNVVGEEEDVGMQVGFWVNGMRADQTDTYEPMTTTSLDLSVSFDVMTCDINGNEQSKFIPGDTVYGKGSGLASNAIYKIWIQDHPVNEGDMIVTDQDPSLAKGEEVITDVNGNFGPIAIWEISSDAPAYPREYNIVAINQQRGDQSIYQFGYDALDSAQVAGFVAPVPELPTAVLFGFGLFGLGAYWTVRRRWVLNEQVIHD
ncbi:MAG: kelch repeat-containing protein [Chloroflexota bacterium]|nr:kelch repeat-containing protein [Chloroflexota bacterium]